MRYSISPLAFPAGNARQARCRAGITSRPRLRKSQSTRSRVFATWLRHLARPGKQVERARRISCFLLADVCLGDRRISDAAPSAAVAHGERGINPRRSPRKNEETVGVNSPALHTFKFGLPPSRRGVLRRTSRTERASMASALRPGPAARPLGSPLAGQAANQ